MVRTEHGPLVSAGFLDLDDQLGRVEHLGGRTGDLSAGFLVEAVPEAGATAGARLHGDPVAANGQLTDRRRGQGDPVFVGLRLGRNPDVHAHLIGLPGPWAHPGPGSTLRDRPLTWIVENSAIC